MRNNNLGDRMKTYENVIRTLFRGKCKTDNKWLYGFPYVTRKNAVKINWYCSEFGSMRTDEVIPETVGQFTGLTDKNGVKIFEGDIVERVSVGERAVISWVKYSACFGLSFDGWCCGFDDYDFSPNDFKVIGNIHDNPEIIKSANP